MTAADDRLAAFLETLEQLPPFSGPTLRGCPDGAQFVRPGQLAMLSGVVSTSRDLDTATEGRAMRRLYAILSRSGRDISPFSARREEQEVVLLPGTVLLLERTVPMSGFEVHLVSEVRATEEPVRSPQPQVERMASDVQNYLTARAAEPARPFAGIPGKFSGDLG